ncbi:MAG: Wzz/FepE/Etk N-terminal domain-containing protein [Deinococcota bacterium]
MSDAPINQAVEPVSTTPSSSEFRDDISLRDLYLTFVRGLPLMIIVALIFGVIAFVYSSFLPEIYLAESTVLISPRPISVQGPGNVSFNPSSDVSFRAYETLAKSRAVLEDAAQEVVSAIPELSVGDVVSTLRRGTTTEILGPVRSDIIAPLAVTHAVRSTDPEHTVILADAWAASSIEAVQQSLLASLDPVNRTTLDEVDSLTLELDDTEARWRDFQASDNGELLAARLVAVTAQIADGETQLSLLERQIAAARGAIDSLTAQLDTETLNTQLETSAVRMNQANDSLNTFETSNNLGLLQAREDELSTTLADREAERLTLASEIAAEEGRVLEIDAALAAQPEQVTLTERVLDNPLLTALLDDVDTLDLTLERDELNPSYAIALERALEARGRLASFQAEQRALEAVISDLQTRLDETRNARLSQESEQRILQAAAEEAETAYRNAYQQVALAELASRQESRALLASSITWRDFEQDLRTQTVALEQALAEQTEVTRQLTDLNTQAESLQTQIADLNQTRSRIERDLTRAQNAYDDVAALQPMIGFVTQLAPTNARVLSPASVPNLPIGPRRTLNTALGIVVGGFLALLFVFLREAVKPPKQNHA